MKHLGDRDSESSLLEEMALVERESPGSSLAGVSYSAAELT